MGLVNNFIIGIPDDDPEDDFFYFLKKHKPSGVMFLAKNYKNLEQLNYLINKIKNISKEILITVDHEGGRVQRFKEPFTVLPSFSKVCKNKSYQEIYDIYKLVAQELKDANIDLNFVPVADMIDSISGAIGDRSIGTDINKVICGVEATIKAYSDVGVMSSVKHFPGHGVISLDTHEVLPISTKTKIELFNYELIPFIHAFKTGVSSVMLSHIIFSQIDSEPVSVSKVFNEIIRKELNFKGLIITDDMSMGAITKYYGVKEACKKSISVGTDLIILSGYNNYDLNLFSDIFDYCY